MKRMFLFFSHKLTEDQMKDAKSLGIQEFVNLPSALQKLFSNVPPEEEDLSEYTKAFINYLLKNAKKGDWVLLQGDYGLVYKLVEFCKVIGYVPVYATTKRVVTEKEIGGKLVKISEFKHIKFRRY